MDVPVLPPPAIIIEIKGLACELPQEIGVPLSRLSILELHREVSSRGIVAKVSGMTLWRWLMRMPLRPGVSAAGYFPRDPDFSYKAAYILDLYEGFWEDKPLGKRDYIISADEKTSIQTRKRKHDTLRPKPQQAMRIEHEYERRGAWTYLAARDIRGAKIFGRCEEKNGIAPFDRLENQVMSQEPYISAERVLWIIDNCSSHRGERSVKRLLRQWPHIILVHLPIHASWLNQIEIYFSIIQRKVLTPNDFSSHSEVRERLFGFQKRYQEVAEPFEWKFTRVDLDRLCAKLSYNEQAKKKESWLHLFVKIRHLNYVLEYLGE